MTRKLVIVNMSNCPSEVYHVRNKDGWGRDIRPGEYVVQSESHVVVSGKIYDDAAAAYSPPTFPQEVIELSEGRE